MVHKPIAIFVILPVAVAGILMLAILAATGNARVNNSTGNAQENNNAGNAQENNNAGNATSTGVPENATSTSGSTASNNTGNASADFANSILAVHNRERAAVAGNPHL